MVLQLRRGGNMKTKTTSEHTRELGVTANIEKRVLIWLAERLPQWVTSDQLTLLGLFAMLMAGLSYWAAQWDERALVLVVVALGLNWFGDSLDGTLARVRNRQRPRYGFYVDHVIDIVGALFLIGGLAASGYMTPLVGLGLLVGYMMVSAEIFLATYSLGVFRISFGPIGGTELRILLSIGTLYLLYKPVVKLGSLGAFQLFDVAGVCGIVGLGVALTVSAIRNTRTLYRAEPLS
jgi:phosphatidylglycerophosphate synthase